MAFWHKYSCQTLKCLNKNFAKRFIAGLYLPGILFWAQFTAFLIASADACSLPMPLPMPTFGQFPIAMKKLLFVCLLFAHAALAQAQDKTANLVLALDRQRFDAQVAKDTAQLNQLLADDLIYVHSSAVVETKREFVANIANGKWDYRTAKLEGTRVRVYGSTAIVTGQGTLDMVSDGKPIVIRLLYTDVYAKRKGKWQMVSWQSTRLPQ
jgi:ketosteroid isomerase-like protein